MGKRCVIMQPTYLPWLGYFDLMDQADVFVILDDVQMAKQSWQTRNRIKTQQGELFLSIPVGRGEKNRIEGTIAEMRINDKEPWRKRHLKSIQQAYSKAPFFSVVCGVMEELISTGPDMIAGFNINIIRRLAEGMGIGTETVLSSDLCIPPGGKGERLLKICGALGADEYLSPRGSASYIEESSTGDEFAKRGIELYYHSYENPRYKQLHGEFIPYMSVIDLLFNEGFEMALSIIRSGRRGSVHHLAVEGGVSH